MIKNIENDLKNTAGDVVHTLTKAGLGSIPIVGGAAAELFNMIIAAPIEKRKDEWMIKIFNTLQGLQDKVNGFQIEELANNEEFISILSRASQLAIINHQKEKLMALHNAVINTALNVSINENEKMMYINLVDTFTPWHLNIIFYFDNPKARLSEKNIITNFYAGSAYEPLFLYYPELVSRKDFISLIVKELYRNGIMNTESLGAMMTADGMVAGRLTEYGSRFYRFIKNYE